MIETWIKFRNTDYLVSNDGRILSLKRRKITLLKPKVNQDGYHAVGIKIGDKIKHLTVHRMVGECFIPNPQNNPVINHKDCNKLNNNVENLEWTTIRENSIHSVINGNWPDNSGSKNGQSKLNETQVLEIKKLLSIANHSIPSIARKFSISRTAIYDIKSGRKWSHV